jgi:hypothetical protein
MWNPLLFHCTPPRIHPLFLHTLFALTLSSQNQPPKTNTCTSFLLASKKPQECVPKASLSRSLSLLSTLTFSYTLPYLGKSKPIASSLFVCYTAASATVLRDTHSNAHTDTGLYLDTVFIIQWIEVFYSIKYKCRTWTEVMHYEYIVS